tara:strand:- start:1737 stop:2435 length:699 start_codon:yes stop_codon:yes gene_type:complete
MIQAQAQNKDPDVLYTQDENKLISPSLSKFPSIKPDIKLGILASGNGSNFEYIIKAINKKQLNADICILIVNEPNCLAIKKAERYNIPYVIIDHRNCSTRLEHDELVLKELSAKSVELVVMAGWMRIVGEKLINKYQYRLINIHPSILPAFKGMDAIQQALDQKVTISGCTVHYVQKEVDSGSIIIQGAVPVMKQDDKEKLTRRIQNIEHLILPFAIGLVANKIRNKFKDKN